MTIKALSQSKKVVIANRINEARLKMSKAEQRLFLYCVGYVDNKETRFDETFEMSIKDFADFLELDKKNFYRSMLSTTRDFIGRVIEFYDDELGKIRQMGVVTTVDYDLATKNVHIRINPDLKPYLIGLRSQFTMYSLQEVMQYKSVYSMRIYQILSQWNYQEKVKYTIEQLRFMLNIEPDEYKLYGDFKRKVLEVAKKEINKSSTLKFSYSEIKTGRKVTTIEFKIKAEKHAGKVDLNQNS
ncbi:MAG: replication initiation protein, partial [Waterburya sp.]